MVHLEPAGIELDAFEDETILDAAFRQGISLAHGCKEGQCSACKALLLAGEVALERYSTFALADYEEEEGYTLLCRAHAYSDLQVELLHYDAELITAGVPIRALMTKVESIKPLTHDIYKLCLALDDGNRLEFHAGQYVDVQIPGTDLKRSYSMCNPPSVGERLEFMIKIYPGGRFSAKLTGKLVPGDELWVRGPYGVFVLREHSDADLIFIGGGAGMAPIWSLLSSLAEGGGRRGVAYYYGARTSRDLFYLGELSSLSQRLPGLRFIPALSEASNDDEWRGEVGLISDVVDRLEGDLSGHDGYLCGPPAMINSCIAMLVAHGMPEARIFYDTFTVTASEGEQGLAAA
jgi:propane monooxygenase reductase subunit